MSDCLDCGKPITRQSTTGRCKLCLLSRRNSDPEFQAARLARLREAMRSPDVRKKMSASISAQRLRRIAQDPEFAARIREQGRRLGKSGKGMLAFGPAGCPARMRAGRKISAIRMAWCPEGRIAEYRQLRKKLSGAEAKRTILESLTGLERQMHALMNGARLIEKPILRKADHSFTLGGVTNWGA